MWQRGSFAWHLFAKRTWWALQPLGGQLWAACPGQAIQAWGSKETQGISIKPSACQRGCKCLACLPGHADTVTVCTSTSGAPQGLPEPQWALTSLLPTSPSQNFPGSQLQKPLPEPLAEIRK